MKEIFDKMQLELDRKEKKAREKELAVVDRTLDEALALSKMTFSSAGLKEEGYLATRAITGKITCPLTYSRV